MVIDILRWRQSEQIKRTLAAVLFDMTKKSAFLRAYQKNAQLQVLYLREQRQIQSMYCTQLPYGIKKISEQIEYVDMPALQSDEVPIDETTPYPRLDRTDS